MRVVNEDQAIQSARGIAGVLKHLIAPWTVNSERLWLGVLALEPGGSTIAHSSPGFEAIHYTLSGTGKEILDGEVIETRPGTCVYIASGVDHQVINTGTETLRVLSVTTPPLPESVMQSRG